MELRVERKWKRDTYTIGNLYIDGVKFCNTLEDTDRGLKSSMPLSTIQSIKIKHKTAIPTGKYKVTLNTFSPSFGTRDFYKKVCNGNVPRLLNVPGFDGILIHVGTNEDHTSGCLLVGNNTIKGGLTGGKEVFERLYKKLSTASDINITIE